MSSSNHRNSWLSAADDYIERVRSDWGHVGLAVAAVRGQDLVYARGFGVKQSGRDRRVDANTLFQVGSATKAFTAAALALLVEEERIGWDDAVVDRLPAFRLSDPWLGQHVTIRDTLTHRSGLVGAPFFALEVLDPNETIDLLRSAIPEARFRDSYRYSNLMYAVAGKLIEAASGVTWQAFVKERLLRPLSMDRSGTTPLEFWDARHVSPIFFGSPQGDSRPSIDDACDRNVAMPHGLDESGRMVVLPWQSYDNAAPAGALVSSVADMANWVMLNVNSGRFRGKQLLSRDTMQTLHATQNLHGAATSFPFARGETYAMGWFRADYHDSVHLSHGGGMLGFPAYVALLPERQLGAVILSNGPQAVRSPYTLRKSIAFWLLDRLLGAPDRDWSGEFLRHSRAVELENRRTEDELNSRPQTRPPSTLPLQAYTGAYRLREASTGIRISLDDGRLTLRFLQRGAFSAPLEGWHGDLFRLRPSRTVEDVLGRQFVRFNIGPGGQVDSMRAFDFDFDRTSQSQGMAMVTEA